jgi:hypothetical protein
MTWSGFESPLEGHREGKLMSLEDRLHLPPGDDILREHLGYASDLVAMSLREIRETPHSDDEREWFRQMSIIEVFWSQASILVEFFTGAIASTMSAAAEHFTQGHVKYQFPSAATLKKMRNDQIAHMNYARTIDSRKKLQPEDMYLTADAIVRALKLFENNLRPDARKVWDERVSGLIQIEPDHIYGSDTKQACTAAPTILRSQNTTGTFAGRTGTFGSWKPRDEVD